MKTRILSGICMLPLLLLVWAGGLPLFFACLLLSALGMHEFYKGFAAMGKQPCPWTGYGSLAALYILLYFGKTEGYALSAWLLFSCLAGLCVSLVREDHDVFDGPLAVLGSLYIGFFCSHIVLLDRLEHKAVWLVFLTAFGTDIMAYFVGYAFGKHKLCPKLSPKKTVEGAVGGVLGSVLFCLVFALLTNPSMAGRYALLGLFTSPFAQAGDLVASAFKRKMGIKDYGKLIPGHGGIMDRIDSVLFTAPVVYYFLLWTA